MLSDLVTLQLEMSTQASRCAAFPDEPVGNPSFTDQYAYNGARVEFHDSEPATSSAVPDKLRAYVTAATDQAGTIAGAAARVTTDGITADVSVMRGLTPDEARDHRENGYHLDGEGFTVTRYRSTHPESGLRRAVARKGDVVVDSTLDGKGYATVDVRSGPCAPRFAKVDPALFEPVP